MAPEEKWDVEQPGWREELIKLCKQAREDIPKIIWERRSTLTNEELINLAMDMAINQELIDNLED
jgi:hypothetical protein